MANLLIVDDNPDILMALRLFLQAQGFGVITAESPEKAMETFGHNDIDLVITDMNFTAHTTSGEEGRAFFYQMRALYPDLPIILITGWAHLETAVELVKAGAADYLAKPWDNAKLLATLTNLLELAELTQNQQQQQQQQQKAQQHLSCNYQLGDVIYASTVMQQLLTTALQVARAPVPVLITGPNGAGKEKLAEIIQQNSAVKNGPFIRMNAGAIPVDLLEAELFGAEAGAYTGLQKTRIGHFEMANGGTLFLDEIGNLPLSGQMKLLRVLQTGEFTRLGSNRLQKAQVRLISATNCHLPQAIAQGEFREDLYYRINLIELPIPALKDRKADILPLARHFLNHRSLSPAACRLLEAYSWPGNVRELYNAVTRASLLAPNKVIEAADLGLQTPEKPRNRPYYEPTEDAIRQQLQRCSSHAEAARQLGLSRQALYRRMEKWGLSSP